MANNIAPFTAHVLSKYKAIRTGSNPTIRAFDLSETTNSPGNTSLYLFYINDNDEPLDLPEMGVLRAILGKDGGNGGQGDFEEFIVTTQNNETLVIINSYQ